MSANRTRRNNVTLIDETAILTHRGTSLSFPFFSETQRCSNEIRPVRVIRAWIDVDSKFRCIALAATNIVVADNGTHFYKSVRQILSGAFPCSEPRKARARFADRGRTGR